MSTLASLTTSSSDALQKLLQMGAAARQTSPGSATAAPAPSAASPPAPPPKPAHHGGGHAGHRFGSDTLSALISSQSDDATDATTASPTNQAAQSLIGADDADSDGALSADEITSALTKAGSKLDAGAIGTAVKSLDSDGDGKLSASEFAAGLKQAGLSQGGAHANHARYGGPGGVDDASDGGGARLVQGGVDVNHARYGGPGGFDDAAGGGAGLTPPGAAPTASDLASSIISATDTSGTGALGFSDFSKALGGDATADADAATISTGSGDLAAAFKGLDGDADGQISRAELTQAIQSFLTTQAGFGANAAAADAGASASASRVSLAA